MKFYYWKQFPVSFDNFLPNATDARFLKNHKLSSLFLYPTLSRRHELYNLLGKT